MDALREHDYECSQTFAHKQAIDLLLLPEVTTEDVLKFVGYTKHLNIGDTGRGTVVLAKEDIDWTTVTSLPSCRRVAAVYASVSDVNLYAPSGTSERQVRENFYTTSAVLTRISST
jgi:hypothetical protein